MEAAPRKACSDRDAGHWYHDVHVCRHVSTSSGYSSAIQWSAAPFSAAALVLSESQTLFNILSKSFVIGEALVDTFDGVSPFARNLPGESVYHEETRLIISVGPLSKEHDEHRQRRPPGQIWPRRPHSQARQT